MNLISSNEVNYKIILVTRILNYLPRIKIQGGWGFGACCPRSTVCFETLLTEVILWKGVALGSTPKIAPILELIMSYASCVTSLIESK